MTKATKATRKNASAAKAVTDPRAGAKPAKPTPAKLLALGNAVITHTCAELDVIRALKAAGGNQPAVREYVVAARVGAALYGKALYGIANSSMDTAELVTKGKAVLARPNVNSTKANRRTEAQERACTAARVYWSRALKAADIATEEKRGGANNKGKAKTGANKAEQAPAGGTAVTIPTATNTVEAHAFLRDMAALMMTFAKKNGKALDVDSQNLINGFVTGAEKLAKRDAPKPVAK